MYKRQPSVKGKGVQTLIVRVTAREVTYEATSMTHKWEAIFWSQVSELM